MSLNVNSTKICIIKLLYHFFKKFATQNYTQKAVSEITGIFKNIEDNISKRDIEQVNNELKNIGDKIKLYDKNMLNPFSII